MARQIPLLFHQGDNLILMTACLRQPPDSVAINQRITRLPHSSFTLPPQDSPLRGGDSPSTNQRAAQIITHLRPPPFLIYTFDRWCLFLAF